MILEMLFNVNAKTSRKGDLGNALESCREGESLKVILETVFNVKAKASR